MFLSLIWTLMGCGNCCLAARGILQWAKHGSLLAASCAPLASSRSQKLQTYFERFLPRCSRDSARGGVPPAATKAQIDVKQITNREASTHAPQLHAAHSSAAPSSAQLGAAWQLSAANA
mmetsp:Transcript_68446/g.152784  ORF Transcript_68446/g.152784 Transcript_68446/m.152784 type:complete len:119 (-) Transcript_68446:1349-1705(-)